MFWGTTSELSFSSRPNPPVVPPQTPFLLPEVLQEVALLPSFPPPWVLLPGTAGWAPLPFWGSPQPLLSPDRSLPACCIFLVLSKRRRILPMDPSHVKTQNCWKGAETLKCFPPAGSSSGTGARSSPDPPQDKSRIF